MVPLTVKEMGGKPIKESLIMLAKVINTQTRKI